MAVRFRRSRNRIESIAAFKQSPSASRQRGLPLIGFEVSAPESLVVEPVAVGPVVLRCAERRDDGRPIGELEVAVFAAALIIDRDGLLEAKASQESGGAPAVRVELPGASGYRAEAVGTSPLPYVYVFAMAPPTGVDGGVLVTVRAAKPDWPAAEAVLRSMRLLTRSGVAPANEEAADLGPLLPGIDGSSKR